MPPTHKGYKSLLFAWGHDFIIIIFNGRCTERGVWWGRQAIKTIAQLKKKTVAVFVWLFFFVTCARKYLYTSYPFVSLMPASGVGFCFYFFFLVGTQFSPPRTRGLCVYMWCFSNCFPSTKKSALSTRLCFFSKGLKYRSAPLISVAMKKEEEKKTWWNSERLWP